MIKNVFFDFDGVLCESVALKAKAFYDLYSPYGVEVAEKVLRHHLANTGVSRFEKIRRYHKEYLGRNLSDQEVKEIAGQYSAIVVDKVLEAPDVPGAADFLSSCHSQYRLWVISATPVDEMRLIVERKGWSSFFRGVFGFPESKVLCAKRLIGEERLDIGQAVFIGDAMADKEAAEGAGIRFILRRTAQNEELFKGYRGYELPDLTGLQALLQSI